jgi:hypothetical protein
MKRYVEALPTRLAQVGKFHAAKFIAISQFESFSFLFILPSFKHVGPQHHEMCSHVAFTNESAADDEKPACLYEYDSSFSSFQTLPSPGFSGLVVRGGRKSEISVRHTPCSLSDAMKASLTLEAWKASAGVVGQWAGLFSWPNAHCPRTALYSKMST